VGRIGFKYFQEKVIRSAIKTCVLTREVWHWKDHLFLDIMSNTKIYFCVRKYRHEPFLPTKWRFSAQCVNIYIQMYIKGYYIKITRLYLLRAVILQWQIILSDYFHYSLFFLYPSFLSSRLCLFSSLVSFHSSQLHCFT